VASIHRDPSSGVYRIMFRLGGRQYHRSLKTTDLREAEALKGRIEYTLRDIDLERKVLPPGADVWQFLWTDGQRTKKAVAPDAITLDQLFTRYEEEMPPGTQEANSLDTFRLHKKHLLGILKGRTAAQSVSTNSSLPDGAVEVPFFAGRRTAWGTCRRSPSSPRREPMTSPPLKPIRFARGYFVSPNGYVLSNVSRGFPPGHRVGTFRSADGTVYVRLYVGGRRRALSLARLVLTAFAGPPRGRVVEHVGGDKGDCRLARLRWRRRGSAAAVLSPAAVRAVRRRLKAGVPPARLAADHGVSVHTIRDIRDGKTWRKGVSRA